MNLMEYKELFIAQNASNGISEFKCHCTLLLQNQRTEIALQFVNGIHLLPERPHHDWICSVCCFYADIIQNAATFPVIRRCSPFSVFSSGYAKQNLAHRRLFHLFRTEKIYPNLRWATCCFYVPVISKKKTLRWKSLKLIRSFSGDLTEWNISYVLSCPGL